MIIIASGEDLAYLDFPRDDAAAKRITERFERYGIPYKVEFY